MKTLHSLRKTVGLLIIAVIFASPGVQAETEADIVTAKAQDPPELRFDHALNSGGMVTKLIQDREGFFWIATQAGLFKWDGYTLQKPQGSPDFIYTVYEDKEGLLWVGGPTGISVYDKSADAFTYFRHDPNDPKSIGKGGLSWVTQIIAEDSAGNIWIGIGGLNKYDKNTKTFTTYTNDPANPNSLSNNNVIAVYVDTQDIIWIGTEDGLDKFDPAGGAFTHYKNDPDDPKSLSNNIVVSLLEDRNGVFWIGTREGGLNRFDKESGTFIRYLHDPGNPHSISADNLISIREIRPGELWIPHHRSGSGLDIFDTTTDTFYNYMPDPDNPDSLASTKPTYVYQDRAGIIWVVHVDGRLDKIDSQSRKFALYRHNPKNANSLGENVIFHVCQDKEGMFWLAFNDKGIDKFDRQTNTFTHYPDMPGGTAIYMLEDKNNPDLVWVTGAKGIVTIDMTTGAYSEVYPLNCTYAQAIIQDRHNDNILWVGTDNAGLVKFDKISKKAVNFRPAPDDPGSISHDGMWHLFMDTAGFIWVPTFAAGLDKFDPKTEKVVAKYRHDPNNPQSLGSDALNHVYEDTAGRIWVSTIGDGLNRLNPDGTFTRYNKGSGFPDNWVGNIIEDNQGLLWLGTKTGLVRFDPDAETWRVYTKEDGLQGNEFWEYPHFKAPDGELWVFGGNGLNSFYPDRLKDNPYKPPVYITSLTQGGEPIEGVRQAPERVTEITLDWQSNFFEFEMAALNATRPEKNQYKYMLEGLDTEWFDAGTKRFGRYSGLPDGKYTLRVIGSNNDGVWNEEGVSLKVTVTPPPWKTTPAYALYTFAVLGLIFAFIRNQQHKIQRVKAEGEAKVLASEMDMAKKIQTVLLPEKPYISGYEIAASSSPADEVGGDYYDVISMGGYDWIIVGDVSGHGLTSGLVMMMVQTAIHTVLMNNPASPPAHVLSAINGIIYENIRKMDETKHMTIVVLAGGKDGKFSFAGLHEDILVLRAAAGKVEEIETDGFWIGMEPDISDMLETDTLVLEPGDCMVLFTDGITEARCEHGMFGNDRLVSLIEESRGKNAAEIHGDIIKAIKPCEKPDDVTLLVMKRL